MRGFSFTVARSGLQVSISLCARSASGLRVSPSLAGCRAYAHGSLKHSSEPDSQTILRRSWLYVPSSSERMLSKSLASPGSDMIIYDLEDSVAPANKPRAREQLLAFLTSNAARSAFTGAAQRRLAIRVNDVTTPFFEEDVRCAMSLPYTPILVLPKVHSTAELDTTARAVATTAEGVEVVASIESARAVWSVGEIAAWRSHNDPKSVRVCALLFAAEDYCADTGVIRTSARTELLYTRSRISLAARAFGLEAIDMVCVNYSDLAYLEEECADGRRLGFTGKQAIHPKQVPVIQRTYVPSEQEILRAARILHQMELAHASNRGAFGLDIGSSGGSASLEDSSANAIGAKEMIDAPMVKQALRTVMIARAAGLDIPDVSSKQT